MLIAASLSVALVVALLVRTALSKAEAQRHGESTISLGSSAGQEASKLTLQLAALRLCSGVFFLPLAGMSLRTLRCGGSFGGAECGSVEHIVLSSVGLVAFVALLAVALFGVFACTSEEQGSKETRFAVPHRRGELLMLLVKAVLALSFAMPRGRTGEYALAFLLAASSGALWLCFCYFVPAYDATVGKLRATLSGFVAWAGACALLACAYDSEDDNAASLSLLSGWPTACFCSFLVARSRLAMRVTAGHIEQLSSPFDMEIALRSNFERIVALQTRIREVQRCKAVSLSLGGVGSKGASVPGRDGAIKATVASEAATAMAGAALGSGEEEAELEELRKESQALSESVKEQLQLAIRRFPSSVFMRIVAARFQLFGLENVYSAQQLLDETDSLEALEDERLTVYMLRCELDTKCKADKEGATVLAYLEFTAEMATARDNMNGIRKLHLQFWSELQQETLNTERIELLGEEVNKRVTQCHAQFSRALDLHADSPSALRLYCEFLEEILNDSMAAKNVAERIAKNEELRGPTERGFGRASFRDTGRGMATMRALFDDKSAVLTMSDEEESIGTLLSANNTACNILGRTAAELVGSNVAMILSPPFSDNYQATLLEELRETSSGYTPARQTTVLALHKRGHVIPAKLTTKHVVTGFRKPMVVAIISPIEPAEGEHCACVNARTGQLIRCTAGLYELLSVTHEDVMREEPKCNVRSFLPQYEPAPAAAIAMSTAASDAAADSLSRKGKKRSSKLKFIASPEPSFAVLPAAAETDSDAARLLSQSGLDTSIVRGETRIEAWASVDRERYAALGVDLLRVIVKDRRFVTVAPPTPMGAAAQAGGTPRHGRGPSADAEPESLAPPLAPSPRENRSEPPTPYSETRRAELRGEEVVEAKQEESGDAKLQSVAMLALLQPDPAGDHSNEDLEMAPARPKGEGVQFAEPSQGSASRGLVIQVAPTPKAATELKPALKSAKEDEAGSIRSGSSSNTGISLANAMALLRKALLSNRGALDPSMKRLRVAFIFTICTLTVLALITHVFIGGEVEKLQDVLRDARLSNVRRGGVALLSFGARALALVEEGFLAQNPYEAHARETLTRYANLVRETSNDIFFKSKFIDAEHRALYTSQVPKVTIVGNTIQETRVTWMDLMNDYASQALMLKEMNLSRVTPENPQVFFITQNFKNVFPAANYSGQFFSGYLERSANALQRAELAILCSALGLVLLSLLFVFRPAVAQVQATKREVFQFFYEIPLAMMEEIKKNIMSKTTDYIQNEEEQERAGGNGGENGEAGGKSSSEEKQEKAAILRRQHSSKTIVLRRQWGLLGQIMLLVIMAVAYFAFVYLFAVNNINKGAGTARSVDWAGRRRVLTALMFTEARRAVVYPFLNDPHRAASQQVHIDNALAHTDFFLFVSNSVLYGNPDAELDPVTGISEDLDQLMFRNACPLIKTPNCETFHRGVMQQGMTAALAEYARLIQNLVFRAQQVANGTVADARAVFFTEDYLDAETMFWDHFLNTGLLKMAELLTTNAIDGMNSAFSLLTSTFAAFFSVSYVLLLFLYDPLVKRLNFQLQRTRAMLLMIPTSVIEENRALRRKLLQAKF